MATTPGLEPGYRDRKSEIFTDYIKRSIGMWQAWRGSLSQPFESESDALLGELQASCKVVGHPSAALGISRSQAGRVC